MSAKHVAIGIISKDDYIKRTIMIAKGQYKPRKSEPKIWFNSLKSMSQVLSKENQTLLKLIHNHKQITFSELVEISQRKKSNLSRTLKTLEKFGIVDLPKMNGRLYPKVLVTDFKLEFGLHHDVNLSNKLNHIAV